ncbi:hypothetical protein GCM10027294_19140 [Marinactinospora endophytica]
MYGDGDRRGGEAGCGLAALPEFSYRRTSGDMGIRGVPKMNGANFQVAGVCEVRHFPGLM